jgi:hypothetical protein
MEYVFYFILILYFKTGRDVLHQDHKFGLSFTSYIDKKKSLCTPDDYSRKTRDNILHSLTYRDNVVRIRANGWR